VYIVIYKKIYYKREHNPSPLFMEKEKIETVTEEELEKLLEEILEENKEAFEKLAK